MQMSITPYCYSCNSIGEIVDKFAKALIDSRDLDNANRANYLRKYYALISDEAKFERMEEIIKIIQKEVFGTNFQKRFQAKIDLRVKSLLSTDAKIQLLQKEAMNNVAAGLRPREIFPRDVFAFRIIILDSGRPEEVKSCYDLVNFMLPFMVNEMGCIMEPSSGTVKTEGFDPKKHPDVLLPMEDAELDPALRVYVKDYVRTPKENGYQALHTMIRDKQLDFFFEIQIGTYTMYRKSLVGTASHEGHKADRYSDILTAEKFDPSKVKIPGFYFYPGEDGGEVVDYTGLMSPRTYNPFTTVNI